MNDDGPFGLAIVLAALAGWVDAAGLSISGRLFLSFMSGNTTDLAIAVAHQKWSEAGTIAAIIALFVAGVAFGEVLEPWGGRRGQAVVLTIEAILLGVGAVLRMPGVAIQGLDPLFPLVFAMGLQNATMHRAGGISIGLTYVTGTLVQIGRRLAGSINGDSNWPAVGKYLVLWLSLATGACLGAVVLSLSPVAALLVAATTATFLAVISGLVQS